jgi:hypothetical protein
LLIASIKISEIHQNKGFTMKRNRKSAWYFLIPAVLLTVTAWGQSVKLTEINLGAQENAVSMEIIFSGPAPKYSVSTQAEDNVTIMVFSIQEATTSKEFNVKVVRPIQHIEAVPPDRSASGELEIQVYLEQKVDVDHTGTEEYIMAYYSWIPIELKAKPNKLASFDFTAEEENSLSLDFKFEKELEDQSAFLTRDRKSIVTVFHNVKAKKSMLKKPESPLIEKIKSENSLSPDGKPYLKIIYYSGKDLMMDVAKEPQRVYMDIHGEEPQEDVLAPDVTKADKDIEYREKTKAEVKEESKKPRKSGKWIYLSLGAAALLGGGGTVAWLMFFQEPPGEEDNTIPEPDDGLFPCAAPPCN